MKKYNVGISILLTILSMAIFYGTKDYAKIVSAAPGAGFWPRVLAIIFIILAIALLVETFLLRKNKFDEQAPIDFKAPQMKRVYAMIGIFCAFGIILYFGGFIIASLIFIPTVMFLLGERNKKKLALMSIIINSVIYLFFTVLLRITLPQPFFM